ncbi:MAG: signal peptidase I [Sandaracinaceae bacterium]|jgi:signal peptidase I|nr:signal peptidase I [Sandaracinaceae bacterium]
MTPPDELDPQAPPEHPVAVAPAGETAPESPLAGRVPDDRRETPRDRIVANVKTIAGAVILAMFIRIVLFEAFEIEGPSMMPTLLDGDRVVVAKFMYGLFFPGADEAVVSWGMPHVGDVIILKGKDGVDIVKRVIGLPGDIIDVEDDVVTRNGTRVTGARLGPCHYTNEPQHELGCDWVREHVGNTTYTTSTDHADSQPPTTVFPLRVPPGEIFVLGDHRDHSNDSRYFGTVSAKRIKGRALFIYWSSETQSGRWRRERMFTSVH